MFEGMEPVEFEHEGTVLRGYTAKPAGEGPFPAVMVMHSAIGIAHEVNEPAARKLAELGYLAVCTDMYGAHLEGTDQVGYGTAMQFLNGEHPDLQRRRIVAWFERIAARPDVDASRVGSLGFCYGGMTTLELARSGADVKVAVSYHGLLTTYARAEPGAFKGHVAVFCGDGDPYAPHEDVEAVRDELRAAGTREFQITVFGAADHGFTDPDAAALGLEGVNWDRLSTDLSWSATVDLLQHFMAP